MIPAGARDAWRELDATLRPFVARRVRSSADVDDVVQSVLLRIQRGLAGLRDDQRFGPWVYQIARSSIADYQRASRRHPPCVVERPVEEAPTVDDDDPTAERELAGHVVMFVAMLPSPYREALTLTELQALS